MIALTILVGTAVLMLIVRTCLPGVGAAKLLSPIGLFVGYLAVAAGVVPVLWLVGWARPWVEIAADPYAAALATVVALIATATGVAIARPLGASPRVSLTTPGNLDVALLSGLAIGIVGYLLLATLAGGPVALLYSLADRRDALAGTGPLRAVLVVSAVACVYGVLHVGKSPRQKFLTWPERRRLGPRR